MLSRVHRLTKQKDFTSLFRGAKSFQGKELVLRVYKRSLLPGENEKEGRGVRVGVVVSKKSAKKAVIRNRLKRVIREKLRAFIPLFPEGTDLAVITKAGVDRMEENQILVSLKNLLERALPREKTVVYNRH